MEVEFQNYDYFELEDDDGVIRKFAMVERSDQSFMLYSDYYLYKVSFNNGSDTEEVRYFTDNEEALKVFEEYKNRLISGDPE